MNVKIFTFPFWGHTEQAIHIANSLYAIGVNVSIDVCAEYYNFVDNGISITECKYKTDREKSEKNTITRESLIEYAESILKCTELYTTNVSEDITGADVILYDSFAFWGKIIARKYNKKAISLMTLQPFENENFAQNCELLLKQYSKQYGSKREFVRMLHIYEVNARNKYDFFKEYSFGDLISAKGDYNIVLFPRHMSFFSEFLGENYIWGRAISCEDIILTKKEAMCAYVAFGSILESKELLCKCIDALLEKGYSVYAKAGRYQEELRNYYSNMSERVHLYKYAPQKEILRKATLFITHGGMNSVMEAIVTQTPMIVIPLANDELINGKMVARNEYGVVCENVNRIEMEEIVELINEIGTNDKYTRRLREDEIINSECALDRICIEIQKGLVS